MKKYCYISCLLFLFSCGNGNGLRNIESYYYPLADLADGKVYEYLPIGNEFDPPMYWLYKSVKQAGAEYLIGKAYGVDFTHDQYTREEKVDNGMKLIDFSLFEAADSSGAKMEVEANIEAGNVFPFFVEQPANILLTSINWQQAGLDHARINLIRNRQFDSDTTVIFQNKEIPAVKFNILELVEHDQEGRLPLEISGEEIYAKGIGLVKLKKNITEGYSMAYQLSAIYPVEDFEEKFNVKLDR